MSVLKDFYPQFVTRSYKKGEIILMQDTEPTSAYAVKVGSVRMYGLEADGSINSISFLVSGELFPVAWIFSKTDKTLFYYEAHTDVTVYVMDRQRLMNAINNTPELSRAFLEDQVNQYVGSTLQVKALGQPRAYTKLISTFHYLCLRYGRDVSEDRVRIEIPFTQDELGSLIGITRETTTNELLALKAQRVITVRSKFYTVNTEKLNALLDMEYDPGIDIK